MKEILPDIHTWSCFSEQKGLDFNGLYIRSGREAVIVDPPQYGEEDLRQMEALGAPRAILLTNKDHVRRSAELAARFGVPIRIHEADAPLVNIPIGSVFRDGDVIEAGLRVIQVPDSKSPGETALLLGASNALIIGDALIGKPAGRLSLLPSPMIKDPEKARRGIRRLLEFPFDAVLVGDGSSILSGGKAALEAFLSTPPGTDGVA